MKNRRSISGSAKCDMPASRSNTRTLPAQPTQYHIERNAARQPPPPIRAADNHAKRSCREHQNFGRLIGSRNAKQHGDPHSPPRPAIIVVLQIGKTKGILRPLLMCGLNQRIVVG
jgi:hypothetical protein